MYAAWFQAQKLPTGRKGDRSRGSREGGWQSREGGRLTQRAGRGTDGSRGAPEGGRTDGSRGASAKGCPHLAHLQLEEAPLLLHLFRNLSSGDLRADHPVLFRVLSLLLLDLCAVMEADSITDTFSLRSLLP